MQIIKVLARQFREGVRWAEGGFEGLKGDEDSLTGGLGQAIRREVSGSREIIGDGLYSWSTTLKKLRGRGKHAPENKLGADGIIELQVEANGGATVFKKSVLFQSKKNWKSRDQKLLDQVKDMEAAVASNFVVNFTGGGYFAFEAEAVIEADGAPRKLSPGSRKSLADILAGDFLECRRGNADVYYDANRERLVSFGGSAVSERRFSVRHRVRTTIMRP